MTRTTGADNAAVMDEAPASNDFGVVVRPLFSSPVPVAPVATTAVESEVAADPASQTLLPLAATRIGFSIRNQSNEGTLHVRADSSGDPATVDNATVSIPPNGYYEDPYRYTGVVTGIWTGNLAGGDLAAITVYTAV